MIVDYQFGPLINIIVETGVESGLETHQSLENQCQNGRRSSLHKTRQHRQRRQEQAGTTGSGGTGETAGLIGNENEHVVVIFENRKEIESVVQM
jgi:excinuclease UvrABC helicase subunit UvrB